MTARPDATAALPAMLALWLVGGCLIGGGSRTVSALELRAGVLGIDPARLEAGLRAAVERGEVWPGAGEPELYLARGAPHLWWNTRLGDNACRIFVHHGADPALADLAVTTCGGRVIQTKQIRPALPCWRLAEVGPRIAAALDYFEHRPLDVQWQIVIGLLHRGQAEQDVRVAFGEPYSRGFDEREDGRRAEKLAFLDQSGDAYGLNVTLIDDRVVAWQMPAERTLTPEAQQRRLAAMEQRLTERLADLERLAIKHHQETVKLFGEVMAKQDDMMSELTTIEAQTVRRPGERVRRDSRAEPMPAGGSGDPGPRAPDRGDRARPRDPPRQVVDGACTCRGWPLGTDPERARRRRADQCEPMSGKDAPSCDTACKAKGYAIGLFNSFGSC